MPSVAHSTAMTRMIWARPPLQAEYSDTSGMPMWLVSDVVLMRRPPCPWASIWRAARWQAPVGFLVGLGAAAAIGHAVDPWVYPSAAFHLFTGAAFFLPFLPQSVFDQTMALSLHLFVVSTQVPNVPEHLPYGVALVLIGIVLLMNSLSIALRMYLRGKKKW